MNRESLRAIAVAAFAALALRCLTGCVAIETPIGTVGQVYSCAGEVLCDGVPVEAFSSSLCGPSDDYRPSAGESAEACRARAEELCPGRGECTGGCVGTYEVCTYDP